MKQIFSGLMLTALVGCAATPTSIVHVPTTVRPAANEPVASVDGSIFRLAAYRPLFEDGHARLVGDTLTITISETTSAVKAAASSGSKNGAVSITPPPVLGLFKSLAGTTAKGATGNSFSDKDAETASNTFTGSINVTVTEVLPNGNLVVAGEKQLALDKGIEFIRFSGVVSPTTIAFGNTVTSANVADARIEYRTDSQIFFLSVLPF